MSLNNYYEIFTCRIFPIIRDMNIPTKDIDEKLTLQMTDVTSLPASIRISPC